MLRRLKYEIHYWKVGLKRGFFKSKDSKLGPGWHLTFLYRVYIYQIVVRRNKWKFAREWRKTHGTR